MSTNPVIYGTPISSRLADEWRKRIEAEQPEGLPRLSRLVELEPGLLAYVETGMIYRRCSVADPAVAEAWIDGRRRLLALPATGQPRTRQAWEERHAADQAAAATEAEERRQQLIATRTPVTLGWLEANPGLPTLAEAHQTLVEHEAAVDVIDGNLRISLSPHAGAVANGFGSIVQSPLTTAVLRDAVRVLFFAEETVVRCLEAGDPLPNGALDPAGRALP